MSEFVALFSGIGENEAADKVTTSPMGPPPNPLADSDKDKEIGLRRTQSFEADEKQVFFSLISLALKCSINFLVLF